MSAVVLLNDADDRDFQPANLRRMDLVNGIGEVERGIVVNGQLAINLDVFSPLHATREAAEVWARADDAKPRGAWYPLEEDHSEAPWLGGARQHR